jgi:hypothetical protein
MQLAIQEIQRAGNPALLSAPRNHTPLPPSIEPHHEKQPPRPQQKPTVPRFTETGRNQTLRKSKKNEADAEATEFPCTTGQKDAQYANENMHNTNNRRYFANGPTTGTTRESRKKP